MSMENHPRDTEKTELAQRRIQIRQYSQRAVGRNEGGQQASDDQKGNCQSTTSAQQGWAKPSAMAIPKETVHLEHGKYGPIFPRSPSCYGFSILAKIIPGQEETFHEYARNIEQAVANQPDCLAVLKLHYLRWILFPINGETYFMYQGIFDADFDKYTEDAVAHVLATLRGDDRRPARSSCARASADRHVKASSVHGSGEH